MNIKIPSTYDFLCLINVFQWYINFENFLQVKTNFRIKLLFHPWFLTGVARLVSHVLTSVNGGVCVEQCVESWFVFFFFSDGHSVVVCISSSDLNIPTHCINHFYMCMYVCSNSRIYLQKKKKTHTQCLELNSFVRLTGVLSA